MSTTVQVGDRIRAYDFRDGQESYVEGTVLRIDLAGEQGFRCFIITVDKDVWNPPKEFAKTRMTHSPFCVPMTGRIINLSRGG